MRLLAPNCSSFSHITHTKILRLSHLSSIISDFFPVNFTQKRAEKKTQGITPFARKLNLLVSTPSDQTASPAWSWATSYTGSGGGGRGGGGDQQEPSSSSDSRAARCTCTRHIPILSSRKASWQASGLLTTSCRSRTSEIIG